MSTAKELPMDDPRFVNFLAGCPFRWQGDHGALQWLQSLYDLGAAGGFPALPTPTISALSPDTGPANTDVTISITGTDFDPLATVNIGVAFGLLPTSVTPTELFVLVQAVNIAEAGTLAVSVKNPDGQVSNTLDFTVS
jgi:IPT/TIG domain